MAYIYQITNDINGKIYIGKTERTIQKRWAEHKIDYLKPEEEIRPLYRAMRKYGIEHFHIELIEETDQPEEREIYWIEQKRSFKNGYNATMGGDGRRYIDYDLVIATYNNVQNVNQTAALMNISDKTVSKILHSNNIEVIDANQVMQNKTGKIVNQYDLQNQFIQSFPSLRAAAQSLNKITAKSDGASTHIGDVCKGKRKTAYGFIWKFAE